MKNTLTALCLALAPAPARAQWPRPAETVRAQEEELTIPYQKYVMDNGLTVVIHEDHSDPLVHVDVTYHVGSAREEIGKSGFAHFFEHMMFQGSDHVADEEHFSIITAAGGTLNGSTNRDRTNYYETLPANQLATALWLEADRMGYLLGAVTQEKFEVQRATVKNERGQRYDNRPYGLMREYVGRTLYPYGHPYSWLTIGYVEDLDRVSVDDLKNFFKRWYGPNNATLTVGGDVTPAEVLPLVERFFGAIPRGLEVTPDRPVAVDLEADRYVSYEDQVRFPLLQAVYPTVPARHPDEPALDCLAEILGGGKSSPLYQSFVKAQRAVQASAYHPTSELAGEFTTSFVMYPGTSLADAEAEWRRVLAAFERQGATDDQVQRFVAGYEASTVRTLASVSGKVRTLAAYQTYTGSPNFLREEYRRYTSVTKADVMRVYRKYLKDRPAVWLSVVPKGQTELVAAPDNFTPRSYADGATQNTTDPYAGLEDRIPAPDSFDRSLRPEAGPSPVVQVPPVWRDTLAAGVPVLGTVSDEVPLTTVRIEMDGGHLLNLTDAAFADRAGLASLTADMLNEDTENYTAEAFGEALDRLGSSVRVYASEGHVGVVVQSLSKHLGATLQLAEERLLRPRFDSATFERLRQEQLEGIAYQKDQPEVIAAQVFDRLLYGPEHPQAVPTGGTETSVAALTLADVERFYARGVLGRPLRAVVVSDLPQEKLLPALGWLRGWEVSQPAVTLTRSTPAIEQTCVYLVDKADAPQSQLRVGYLALPYDPTGTYYRLGLMNFPLGGAFNSRINLNLREDKGYTYGARSGFQGSERRGPFVVSTGVRADATDSALVEIMSELRRYRREGITSAELSFLRSAVGQREALAYETPVQKSRFLSRLLTYNLDTDYTERQNEILQSITEAEIDALAREYLPTGQMNIVVVGDKATVGPGLRRLGYDVVELDKQGVSLP